MVKIRLARHGKRNDPHYRIVAIDSHKKNVGQPLAILGFWHPKKDSVKLDKKAIDEWIAKGAQMTKAVEGLYK